MAENDMESATRSLFWSCARLMLVGAVAGIAYYKWARPRILNWGTVPEDVDALLPGDDLIDAPRYRTTHAIDIDASVESVWPWLVQIGADRGGFYSYEWLENLAGFDVRNTDTVIDAFQDLKVGDRIRLSSDDRYGMEVVQLDPNEALVLRSIGDRADARTSGSTITTWAFVLQEIDSGACRLLTRIRKDFVPTPANLALHHGVMEPCSFLMERKMLQVLKERAEAYAASVSSIPS